LEEAQDQSSKLKIKSEERNKEKMREADNQRKEVKKLSTT